MQSEYNSINGEIELPSIKKRKVHEWSNEHEVILVDWADKAMCYKWLHAKANSKYSRHSKYFTIPVIIISTLTGTANFAQDRVPEEYLNLFVMVIGTLNILAGIISTIQQFLKINELKESHRISSISWDKFYRNIKVELAKKPDERIPIEQMLKMCKEEYDRLIETSPKIETIIIDKFKKTFKDTPHYGKIKKPEICDELITTDLFRFIPDNKARKIKDAVKKGAVVINKQKLIYDFITQFEETHHRPPLLDELREQIVFTEQEKKDINLENDDDIDNYFTDILEEFQKRLALNNGNGNGNGNRDEKKSIRLSGLGMNVGIGGDDEDTVIHFKNI